jgi:PKD repeat protein
MQTCSLFQKWPYSLIVLIISFSLIMGCTREDPPLPDPPEARFGYTSSRNFPIQVTFTNTSTTGLPGPTGYVWDFGDGSTIATISNPVHMYVSPGAYNIALIQSHSDGTKDTAIAALALNPLGPSGTSSRTGAASFTMMYNSSFTTVFTNNSVRAESYLWNFGDGTTSTTPSPTKIYTAPGTYHVVLAATGPGGVDTCGATITF